MNADGTASYRGSGAGGSSSSRKPKTLTTHAPAGRLPETNREAYHGTIPIGC